MTVADVTGDVGRGTPFERLVLADAFDRTDETHAALTADPERWAATLSAIITDTNGQLATADPTREGFVEWRRKVLAINRRAAVRMQEAKHLARSQRIRAHDLERAVWHHREASIAGGYQPEPHDLALWAAANLGGGGQA